MRWLIAAWLLLGTLANAVAADFSVTGINQISEVRFSRTLFDYTYTINVTNTGPARTNIIASVTSTAASTTILQGQVALGSVAGGSSFTSTATFAFRQDRSVLFDPTALHWQFTYDQPPTLAPIPPQSVVALSTLTLQLQGSDPAGKALTYSYSPQLQNATLNPTTGAFSFTPSDAQVGTSAVTFTVSNGQSSAAQSVQLTVTSRLKPPVITSKPPTAATAGTAYSYQVVATDPQGTALTYTLVTAPQGMSIDSKTGLITWTPAAGQVGTGSIDVRVTDALGLSTDQSFAVTVSAVPVNHPPVWSPVANQTMGVGTTRSVSLVATDPDGDSLKLTVTPLPAFASFSDLGNGTGTLSLHPAQNQAGTYSLTATAADTKGASASVVLTVTVTSGDRPPTANAQTLTFVEDTPAPLTLLGADPDGDPLTYSIVAAPAHGTLSGTAPQLLYKPSADYFGPDSFQFVTNDGTLSSQPATVAITVTEVNDRPVLGPDVFTMNVAGTLPSVPPPPQCQNPCGVIYADPHVLNYDQSEFDVQAVGEVIATKSTTDDFEVQARLAPIPGQRIVSIAVAVAMRVAGHRVAFYRTSTPTGFVTRIDGNPVTLSAAPQALPGGGTIGTYGTPDTAIVTWPDGSHAIVQAVGLYVTTYRFTLEVGLAPARLGHVVGILGNADGNKTNDLVTRSGQPIAFPDPPFATFYGTYIKSWRISMAETLFDYDPGKDTSFYTDLTFPDAPATTQTLSAAALSKGTSVCSQFNFAAAAAKNACIVDVGITGDADFATEGAVAQAANLGLPSNAGKTTIGSATTVTIATPGTVAVRTFAGTAGQPVTLAVTGNNIAGVTLTVRDPNGGYVTSSYVSTATGFHDTFTLPLTGTYTITVDPDDQLIGTLTFNFGAVSNNVGSTMIGTPTSVVLNTIGEVAVRSFAATAGQQLTFAVTGNTTTGATLTIRDPNGYYVTSLYVSTATGFHDTFTLPVSGTYTMTVDPYQQLTGALTFTLDAVPNDVGITVIGISTKVAIGTIGENAVRSFAGTAGQYLTFNVTGNTIAGVTLTVRDPGGSYLTSLYTSTATGFHDSFTLPATGTYTITVDPSDQLAGSLTFVLNAVPNDVGPTAIGTPTTVMIGTIGENAVRSFAATAGQDLTMTVTGNTIPGATLTVRDPGGSYVASLYTSTATGFRDTFTLPVTGTYTITVDPSDQVTGGLTFVLGAVPKNVGTITIGTPTSVTMNTIGQNAVRSFAATAGQNVSFTVIGNTIAGVTLTIRDPGGSYVTSLYLAGSSSSHAPVALPVSGTYTMTVDPSDQLTGSLTFTLVGN